MHDLNTLSTWVAIRAKSEFPATPVHSVGGFRLFAAGTSIRSQALCWLIGFWGRPPSELSAAPFSGPRPWNQAAQVADRASKLS